MNGVERESRDIVTAAKQYHAREEQNPGEDSLTEYLTQLAVPPDEQDAADRKALHTFLTEQQPRLLAQITALQDQECADDTA